MSSEKYITVIGGGLAGSEAAHQAAKLGVHVKLYEMRPQSTTPAHKSGDLGELVCSNSLKSESTENASGILKQEMRVLDSIVLDAADVTRVPAGKALAVDRIKFARYITDKLDENPLIDIIREELKEIPPSNPDNPVIIASGPLTSDSLSTSVTNLFETEHLYFYDSISPIIDADSIDYSKVYRASRYEHGETEEGDYLNCPFDREGYYRFIDDILEAEKIETRDFEKGIYFESCLPIEVSAERGKDTLRFGPARPVGLEDPRDGRRPYAVVQLRCENTEATMYNIVGFQTKLRYPEQKRVFRTIPGLENAEFLRFGSVHRNTYINSPMLLKPTLQTKANDFIFFAGQITGVEGYVESAAMGIIAGINAAMLVNEKDPVVPPTASALRCLLNYITNDSVKKFQPMNINFGLFPPLNQKVKKTEKKKLITERSQKAMQEFKSCIFV